MMNEQLALAQVTEAPDRADELTLLSAVLDGDHGARR